MAGLRCGRVRPWTPAGLRIVDYLSGLDRRFRVVGARVFDTSRRVSPRTSLTAIRSTINRCARNCRLPGAAFVTGSILFSAGTGPVRRSGSGLRFPPLEPRQGGGTARGCVHHHFQYRNRPDTSGRLRRLCERRKMAWSVRPWTTARRVAGLRRAPAVGDARLPLLPGLGPHCSGRRRGATAPA